MASNKKILAFPGPIVILGFGSIGQAVLPLLLRHIDVQPSQMTIIAKDEDGIEIAKKYGIRQAVLPLMLRHIDVQPSQMIFFFKQKTAYEIAKKYGIRHVKETLIRKN